MENSLIALPLFLYFFNPQQNSHNCSNNAQYSPRSMQSLRTQSSVHTQQPAGPVREIQIDPYIILDDELKYFYDDVRDVSIVSKICTYIKSVMACVFSFKMSIRFLKIIIFEQIFFLLPRLNVSNINLI